MARSSRQLIVGQLIGQVALLAAIPVLTRTLGLGEMGVYQAGFSIALILQPLATWRRELLIPVSSVADANRLRRSGLALMTSVSAALMVAGAVLLLFAVPGAETALVAGLVLLSLGLISIENAYLIRQGTTSKLALRNLIGGLAAGALQVAFAFIVPTALSVAFALVTGRLMATVLTHSRSRLQATRSEPGSRSTQRSFSAVLSAMVATASNQSVVLASFGLLGAATSAQIAVGQRIGGAPTTLIGQALSQLALASASPLLRERRPGLSALLRSQILRTAALSATVAVMLMVGAPLLAEPLLGPGWALAGQLTAIFAIPMALQLVALPATTLMIPLGRERLLLALQCMRLLFVLIVLTTSAVATKDVIITCISTSAAWALAYVPLLVASIAAARQHDRESERES